LWICALQSLSLSQSYVTSEVKQAVVNDAEEHCDKAEVKQNHAERDDGNFPVPDPAEKTTGYIDDEEEEQSVEPERGENHFRSLHAAVDSGSGYTRNEDNDQQHHGQAS
jgi:hypothetical protein